MKLVQTEGEEWKEYFNPNYRKALDNSITFVALIVDELCGYSRSLSDSGLFIWVVDLPVKKAGEGFRLEKKIMDCILTDIPDIDVFVMSDVATCFEKLVYKKEGSIFEVKRTHNKT